MKPSPIVWTLLCAALLAPAAGCTLFDDYLPGTPFTPDQPVAEVSLIGVINLDPVARNSDTCPPGGTVFWGSVRNTGDLDVDDVTIVLDVFGPTGAFLGTFSDKVYNGEIVDAEDELHYDSASTSLFVEQSGAFSVCSPLRYGTAARAEYRTEFVVIDTTGNP